MFKRQLLLMSIVCLSWVAYVGGLVYLGLRGHWLIGIAWLVGVPLIQWAHRELPAITPSPRVAGQAEVSIAVYPKSGCRSCVVLQQRLEDLRSQLSI